MAVTAFYKSISLPFLFCSFRSLNFEPGKTKENAIEANDIADIVYFLCQSSKYINFTDINVDPIKKVVIKK